MEEAPLLKSKIDFPPWTLFHHPHLLDFAPVLKSSPVALILSLYWIIHIKSRTPVVASVLKKERDHKVSLTTF